MIWECFWTRSSCLELVGQLCIFEDLEALMIMTHPLTVRGDTAAVEDDLKAKIGLK